MKIKLFPILLSFALISCGGSNEENSIDEENDAVEVVDSLQTESYVAGDMNVISTVYGNILALNLKRQGLSFLNAEKFTQDVSDHIANKTTGLQVDTLVSQLTRIQKATNNFAVMTDEQKSDAQEIFGTLFYFDFQKAPFFEELVVKNFGDGFVDSWNNGTQPSQEAYKVYADYNAKQASQKGDDFLAANAKRPEVKVTETGLQYEIIREGNGERPSDTNTVIAHYEGTLIDGTVFDSSYDRGEPTEFPLNRVIPGWTEGLQLMDIGSKYKLYIPYNLGYGAQGAGAQIPPYSALIFTIELKEIK